MTEVKMYLWNIYVTRLKNDKYTTGVTSKAEGAYYPRTPGLTLFTMVRDN